MSVELKKEDKLGAVLIQVQDDLKRLKCSLESIDARTKGKRLDIQALDNAISRTESCIRKHAEDYLKAVNRQLLVLPVIEDIHRNTVQIPKWKPSLERIPDVHPQKERLPEPSLGKKHKPALDIRLLCNPTNPSDRSITQRTCGITLPDVHKKRMNKKHHRFVTGPMARSHTIESKNIYNVAIPEEDTDSAQQTVLNQAASLHTKEGPCFSKTSAISLKFQCHKIPKWKAKSRSTCDNVDREYLTPWTTKTPPPSTTSRSIDQWGVILDNIDLPICSQNPPVPQSQNAVKYLFTIINGRINQMAVDFCHFKHSFSLFWGILIDPLKALETLLRDFAVPFAKVNGERLVEFGHGWDNHWRKAPPVNSLLSVLENWEEVSDLVSRPGQRFKGEGGIEAAAIHIQSCWRRHVARAAYLSHCRHKSAVETITISWLMHIQMRRVRKALQARRFRQLENYRGRTQHLATNWKHIQSSKRTIIHIPSLGYHQSLRLNLKGFDILQNIQIGRLCEIRDENVEVIYISSQHLEEDILHYYTTLLKSDRAPNVCDAGTTEVSLFSRRFIVLTPEALDYFPTHNMCLSTLLKYSPRTLKRIKNLIQGKQAYMVGGVTHVDDLAVADELGVPILGPEPEIAQLHSTKSGSRKIFTRAEVDVPPGRGDIYSLNQLHETLAELMAQNLDVQRWLFKMDSEHSGRGAAYCDTCHLNCYNWALQERRRYGPELWNTKQIQESVLLRYLDEIPEWLACYARPAKTSCYPNWACFLKTFLRQGGVVEAYPPSHSVTCLTVDLLLEPGGEVTMLSCGDQLHGSCRLENIGSTVPQTSVDPKTLHSICMRVGQACVHCLIVGYVSLDLATFVNHTMEQKVWATDLYLTYSDHLAMTQMLLMVTGGALNFHTGCLEVPKPVTQKCCEHQKTNTPPVVNCYAVIGIHLFHSNLSMLYHYVFLKMCRAHGIGFNRKTNQGSVFALYDTSNRCRIAMITVSEGLQGALVTFARNLSVIHQEISSSRMPGETNFKGLIKNIEDVLQMTAQNKLRAVKDKP